MITMILGHDYYCCQVVAELLLVVDTFFPLYFASTSHWVEVEVHHSW